MFLPSAHHSLAEGDEVGPLAGIFHNGSPSLYPRVDVLYGRNASPQPPSFPKGLEKGQNGREFDPVLVTKSLKIGKKEL
jgi:hypothetical protein